MVSTTDSHTKINSSQTTVKPCRLKWFSMPMFEISISTSCTPTQSCLFYNMLVKAQIHQITFEKLTSNKSFQKQCSKSTDRSFQLDWDFSLEVVQIIAQPKLYADQSCLLSCIVNPQRPILSQVQYCMCPVGVSKYPSKSPAWIFAWNILERSYFVPSSSNFK